MEGESAESILECMDFCGVEKVFLFAPMLDIQPTRWRKKGETLQETLEDRAAVRLARELPTFSCPLRAQGREFLGLRASRVHHYPAQAFHLGCIIILLKRLLV